MCCWTHVFVRREAKIWFPVELEPASQGVAPKMLTNCTTEAPLLLRQRPPMNLPSIFNQSALCFVQVQLT